MGPIEEFLGLYPKKSTRKSYGAAIRLFLDSLFGPQRARTAVAPEEQEVYERLAAEYLERVSDPAADMIRFIAYQTPPPPAPETPPKTVGARVVGVIQFLAHHNIDLSARDRRRIKQKIPKGGAVTKRGDLGHEQIRAILAHCDEHGRALYLLLASSGMRIGEALALRLRDIDIGPDTVPASIDIRAGTTKARTSRTAFMSSEAADAIRTWLEVRAGYLDQTVERSGSGCIPQKSAESDLLFPFSAATAERHWTTALTQAGLYERDERTGRATRSPHGLRGFAKSQLCLGCPEPVVDELIGHTGYLSNEYRRYSRQQLAEYYLAAESHVLVLLPAEYKELKSQVSVKLSAHSELLESVISESVQTKARLAQMEQQVAVMHDLLREDRLRVVARELERE